jgi:hypothetical protein
MKHLCLETITFSDATLSDINVVLCYILSQYRLLCHHYQAPRYLYFTGKFIRNLHSPLENSRKIFLLVKIAM